MYCPKCGKYHADEAKFCAVCGNPLTPQTIRVISPQTAAGRNQTGAAQNRIPPAVDPTKSSTLGIIALASAFINPLLGLILGLIDYNAKDGYSKKYAKWAIIASVVLFVLRIVFRIATSSIFTELFRNLLENRNIPI